MEWALPLLLPLQGKTATYPYLSEGKGFHVSPLEVGDSVRMKLTLSFSSHLHVGRGTTGKVRVWDTHRATFTRGRGCWIVKAFWMFISEGTWCIWTQEAEIESIFGSSWQGVKWGWKGRWWQTTRSFASSEGVFTWSLSAMRNHRRALNEGWQELFLKNHSGWSLEEELVRDQSRSGRPQGGCTVTQQEESSLDEGEGYGGRPCREADGGEGYLGE